MRRMTSLLHCAARAWLSVLTLPPIAAAQRNPPPVNVAADAAFVQQIEQQYGPAFRYMYRAELHFMRIVCQPTKEQYDKIAADGEPAVKEALRKCAEATRHNNPNAQVDLRAPLVEAITKAVRTSLSAEQAARYQKELDRRAAARKRMVLRNLVSKVDKVLLLTKEQRQQLGEILEKHWAEVWNQTQMYMYGYNHFPSMPDTEILALLTEAQKTAWHGVQKGQIYFGIDVGVNIAPGVAVDEEVWDDHPPEKPAEKKP